MLFLLISNSLNQSYLWNLSCPAGPEPAQIPNSVSLESSPHDLYAMTLRAGYSVVHLLKSLYLIALASGLLMAGKPTYFFFSKVIVCYLLLFYINFFILWYQFWHQKLMIMPWQHCCLANQQAYLLTKVVVFYLFIVLYGLFLWNLAPETWSFQKVL